MAAPRRRSARLSKTPQKQRTSNRKAASTVHLESLVERDETPDVTESQSIDNVLATPASAETIKSQLSKLSGLKTPRTEPRPDPAEMHPELVHHSTAKAPDSGLKLGFVDIPPEPLHSIESAQNTPTKARTQHTPTKARTSSPANLSTTAFDFKFNSESQLSTEAQQLMETVREEAARIKTQMQAEKEAQLKKDEDAEASFNGINASGRKIAKPKSKAGRFSDIHMAQFKKMDSIANHPSAYRARPGYAQPTAQSLKRSPSKAGLDDVDRPRTSGKGTPGRARPPFLGRPTSVSPFKSIPAQPERLENTAPAKRARHSVLQDVSACRPAEVQQSPGKTTVPRPVSSRLLSPTKASLARSAASQIPVASPNKAQAPKRTASVRSLKTVSTVQAARPATSHGAVTMQSPSKLPQAETFRLNMSLPSLPSERFTAAENKSASPQRLQFNAEVPQPPVNHGFASRLPKFAGLKSILRPGRKIDTATPADEKQPTPIRHETHSATPGTGSVKKVDFTPSVKSRYAVKLAAASPSPAKLPHLTPGKALPSAAELYDPAAYVLQDEDDGDDDNWEDAESEIDYPTLPDDLSSPARPKAMDEGTFSSKAKNHNRRESKEFKSIFTTLHHPSRPAEPSTLTSVNTMMNKTDPTIHANRVMRSPSNPNFSQPSPSTIRRVRTSGVTEFVQPFEDTEVQTVPHGLPGKKRRRESTVSVGTESNEETSKENRRISVMPSVPGGWRDTPSLDSQEQDEGDKRGGKRMRVDTSKFEEAAHSPAKKTATTKKPRQSSARELAKNNAKERKTGGILSLSRLNMLARPKQRS
ncbi:hypothetical protein HRR83_005099 [Exophiala dermatitidis]|uniref:Erythromycin esterase n=2 Tax=Exophiala dermatitidis TaxID=5970 RepID=H6C326_EXODN|nr:uncharacterized protein HMPREF1120_06059 [Exophiala dermatitidis NIH/UT8656]KAJ4513751.1 hypothetical protein HRR75_004331 [Exophiala dermatitidis]EHY58041.1 hypothetical protein HMPREF1120_06059 [Exophiala dermatitidis NIH/UT8656]KAJ4516987.1 hypothetical protein HRR74_004736 [Exophiala dermatitidis]KAJ4519834.1 hypothetical protein HRR73_003895 [Exophiala dermatitidis]KAJ4534358.1 hypothetical protein HRR76_006286 [Exophiala dermatitidis]